MLSALAGCLSSKELASAWTVARMITLALIRVLLVKICRWQLGETASCLNSEDNNAHHRPILCPCLYHQVG